MCLVGEKIIDDRASLIMGPAVYIASYIVQRLLDGVPPHSQF